MPAGLAFTNTMLPPVTANLPNTEWSNSRWAWARDRWLWSERHWEKRGFKTAVENATGNVKNRSTI